MKGQDVAHFGSRANPVLCGEAKSGQPAHLSIRGGTNNLSEGFLASGMSICARETPAARPSTVSVHDACHMQALGRGTRGHGSSTLVRRGVAVVQAVEVAQHGRLGG